MNELSFKKLIFVFGVLIIVSSMIRPMVVQASDAQIPPLQGKGIRTAVHDETGYLSFIGADPNAPINVPGAQIPGLSAGGRAMAIIEAYGPQFGLQNPGQELQAVNQGPTGNDRFAVRYQQKYKGIPVLAGELMLNMTDQGQLISISGEISPNLDLSTTAQISTSEAKAAGIQTVAKSHGMEAGNFVGTTPKLWVFDERLLRPSEWPAELVWRFEVKATTGAPINELVLVNAERGYVSLHFNQIDTFWQDKQASGQPGFFSGGNAPRTEELSGENLVGGTPVLNTYTAGNAEITPGTPLCSNSVRACGSGNADGNSAHAYAYDSYNFYYSYHNRDSINGAGMAIISTVEYGSGIVNAYWNGLQMIYGDGAGFAYADDVVGHELTHGVTDYNSNLYYYYQSGAINESLSDMWGEFIDLTNGYGTDTSGVRWQMGEDVSGLGVLRDMSNPPAYGDPDKMTSSNYHLGDLENLLIVPYDNGGVHFNSGVNNKAVYLMTDGDSFNGFAVTGMGINKVAAIYYEVQTNLLTSGSDYKDLYYAVYQACLNLVGGAEGITGGNCIEVQKALNAVEMDHQPISNFNPDAEICSGGLVPNNLFFDDFESGDGNWTFETSPGATSWGLEVGYAASGATFLYGSDDNITTEIIARMTNEVAIPATGATYLHFFHAYGFESYDVPSFENYDGGVLEIQIDGGSWLDAAPAFNSGRNYNGTIYNYGGGNVLQGRKAFVADSHGYVSSKYNLGLPTIKGHNVRFRWRIGTDFMIGYMGWLLDDVRIYTCVTGPPPCNTLTLTHTGSGSDPSASPTNSTGCSAGTYHPGESISLSGAAADPGWVISGWTGTDNDASVADTNTVTMPASAHVAEVNYAVPPGVGTYDDRYSGINYSGSWVQSSYGGPYNGTITYSNEIGSSGSFSFNGDEVTLVYTAYLNRGTMDVYIDDLYVDTINQYSPSLNWQQTWSSGSLGSGVHTISFEHWEGATADIDAFMVTEPPTPPSNDDIVDAINISSLPYGNTQDTSGATLETGEPSYNCGSFSGNSDSVWYSYTPGATGIFHIDTYGSNFDTVVNVFEDLGGGSYSPVMCSDDISSLQSELAFLGTSGHSYLVSITAFGGGSGGSLSISIDETPCPAGSLCMTVADNRGEGARYPDVRVLDGGDNYVAYGYGNKYGYVETGSISAGSYKIVTASETQWGDVGIFVVDNPVTAPGYFATDAIGLPSVDVIAKDTSGNFISANIMFAHSPYGRGWVGYSDWDWPLTVYFTPGIYDINAVGWWDHYLISLENQTLDGGTGTVTMDTSVMDWETLTFHWDGFTEAIGFVEVPFANWYVGSYLMDGEAWTISVPAGVGLEYNAWFEVYEPPDREWTYYMTDNNLFYIDSPGGNTDVTYGGDLSVNAYTSSGNIISLPGDSDTLYSGVSDAHGNEVYWIDYYEYTSFGAQETEGKTHRPDPSGKGVTLAPTEEPTDGGFDEKGRRSQDINPTFQVPTADVQEAWVNIAPSYQVLDGLGLVVPGTEWGIGMNAHHYFTIPNPANLGLWLGQATFDFGPYPHVGSDTDNAEFFVLDMTGPLGVGTYDDRYAGIYYSSGWGQLNMGGPYLGTLTNSTTVGNSGAFAFDGEGITLVYLAYSNGTIEVSIDGGPVDIIDTSSGGPLWQQEWSSGPLAAGVHTIAFTHASGANVYVDAFIVTGPPPPPTCWALTLTHTGSGSDPVASPTNSTGCSAGYYHVGETIFLSGAAADPGWFISGWTGTDNDAIPAPTNTVTMPDSIHVAGVNYVYPAGVGTYDDRYAGINYSGSWSQINMGGPYLGTMTNSTTVGNNGLFTFDGEGITLVYLAYSNGTMNISIDGVPVDTVNTSSPTPMWQQEWSSGPLAAGVHTIAFEHASGANVYVDAFIVTGPPPPPTCWALTLTHTGSGSDPVASPTNSTGCSAGYYHVGETIFLSGAAADPGWAISSWTGTDTDASTGATNIVTMPDSAHTATVNYVQPPGIGTYDDRYAGISYSVNWSQINIGGPYLGTLTKSSASENSGLFTFDGEGITLMYFAYIDGGYLNVEIDGGVVTDSIDMYSPIPLWQQEWESGPLSPGVHTISFENDSGASVYVDAFIVTGPPPCYTLTLTHTGSGTSPTALPSNSTGCSAGEYHPGETINLSGASADPGWIISGWTGTDNDASGAATNTVTMPASAHVAGVNYAVPPGVGTYDDRFAGINYSGSWVQGSLGGTYDGTLTYSSTIGNEGSFTFDGVGITLVFFAYIDGGELSIFIDGVPVDTIFMYNAGPLWQQEWYSGALSPGVHTILFIHVGGPNVYVDAFIVEGP